MAGIALLIAAACGGRAAVQPPSSLPPAPHPAVRGPAIEAVQRAGRLRVAADLSVPPMAFRDASGPAGLDVELVEVIARALGVRADVTDTPMAVLRNAIPSNEDLAVGALTAGMVPGAATEPYAGAVPTIVWGTRTQGTAVGALRGKRVAASFGRLGERLARDAGATLILTYLPEESLAMVGDGRVDAAIADGPEALAFAARRRGLHTSAADGQAASFVIVAQPAAPDLAAYASAVIRDLRSSGGLEQLRRRWHL
jgi:ABC-type amino acid transport substrate-binding protein